MEIGRNYDEIRIQLLPLDLEYWVISAIKAGDMLVGSQLDFLWITIWCKMEMQ